MPGAAPKLTGRCNMSSPVSTAGEAQWPGLEKLLCGDYLVSSGRLLMSQSDCLSLGLEGQVCLVGRQISFGKDLCL